MIFKDCVHLNHFYFSSYYNYVSHSRYYCYLVYIQMLKIHSGNTSPVEEHIISSPQLLQCCSFLNTSMTPNCLFIIEITGDFSRIKWQVIKFSLWLWGERGGYNGAVEATLPSPGNPSILQTDYILLLRNIWNSEQATDLDRNPGISRATPVYGCYGICQSATFQSKAPSAKDHIDMLRREHKCAAQRDSHKLREEKKTSWI